MFHSKKKIFFFFEDLWKDTGWELARVQRGITSSHYLPGVRGLVEKTTRRLNIRAIFWVASMFQTLYWRGPGPEWWKSGAHRGCKVYKDAPKSVFKRNAILHTILKIKINARKSMMEKYQIFNKDRIGITDFSFCLRLSMALELSTWHIHQMHMFLPSKPLASD